ncbi:MAG: hypothetical protein ACTTHI_05650 [Prevotella sp.]
MDIIRRNLLTLLKSGALNEYGNIEPMSSFKWEQLLNMAVMHNVSSFIYKGLKHHQYDKEFNIPKTILCKLEEVSNKDNIFEESTEIKLSNKLLNIRLKKIRNEELSNNSSSLTTLDLLELLIDNVNHLFRKGLSIKLVLELGIYLKNNQDDIDFNKLNCWLSSLHIVNITALIGSILVTIFKFDKAEVPFVDKISNSSYTLFINSLGNLKANSNKVEWTIREGDNGFVYNNLEVLRKNIKRSFKYFPYAPIEASSNFITSFCHSISDVQE